MNRFLGLSLMLVGGSLWPLPQGQSSTQVLLPRAQGEVSAIPDVAGPLGVREGLLRHHPERKMIVGQRDSAALGKEMRQRSRGPGSPLGQGHVPELGEALAWREDRYF